MSDNGPTHQERLARIKRESDYPLTYFVINPINRLLVGPVARLGISPNAVTCMSFAVSVVGAYALYQAASGGWFPYRIAAPLLVFLAHLLDCLDGDLARYKAQYSLFGKAIDPVLDRVSEFFFLFAITLGVFLATGDVAVWYVGSAAIGGLFVYYYASHAHFAQVAGNTFKDTEQHSFVFGEQQETRVRLGLFEPAKYTIAVGPSLGLSEAVLWIIAAASWLGFVFQVVKVYRRTRTDSPEVK